MTVRKRSKLQRLGFGPIRDPRARDFHVVLREMAYEPSLLGRLKLMDELGPLYTEDTEEIAAWSIQVDRATEMQKRRGQKSPRGKKDASPAIIAKGLKLLSKNAKHTYNSLTEAVFKSQKRKSPSRTTIWRALTAAKIIQRK